MTCTPKHQCHLHVWERRLEIQSGVECVVRVCLSCGVKELVWARRPLVRAREGAREFVQPVEAN